MAQGQVLLVEDEPHIAEAIRFILGRTARGRSRGCVRCAPMSSCWT
jgi:phage baseplate assembly protein W